MAVTWHNVEQLRPYEYFLAAQCKEIRKLLFSSLFIVSSCILESKDRHGWEIAVHFEGLVAGCSIRGHGPKGNFRFHIYNFAQTVRAAVKVGSQPRSNVN